mmetsp:Transcript_31219/g.54581  ORF Transcript_31219/g.54581 Transcript_31219/m.54581 type:complete len:84 (+) Transcript_31219:409-660(+)
MERRSVEVLTRTWSGFSSTACLPHNHIPLRENNDDELLGSIHKTEAQPSSKQELRSPSLSPNSATCRKFSKLAVQKSLLPRQR